jgi:hypothetical protein
VKEIIAGPNIIVGAALSKREAHAIRNIPADITNRGIKKYNICSPYTTLRNQDTRLVQG